MSSSPTPPLNGPKVYVNGVSAYLMEDLRLPLYQYFPEGTRLFDPAVVPPREVLLGVAGDELGVTRRKLQPEASYVAYSTNPTTGALFPVIKEYTCVYLFKLPPHTTPEMLKRYFDPISRVVTTSVFREHQGVCNGRGCVVLEDPRKLLLVPRVLEFLPKHYVYTELSDQAPRLHPRSTGDEAAGGPTSPSPSSASGQPLPPPPPPPPPFGPRPPSSAAPALGSSWNVMNGSGHGAMSSSTSGTNFSSHHHTLPPPPHTLPPPPSATSSMGKPTSSGFAGTATMSAAGGQGVVPPAPRTASSPTNTNASSGSGGGGGSAMALPVPRTNGGMPPQSAPRAPAPIGTDSPDPTTASGTSGRGSAGLAASPLSSSSAAGTSPVPVGMSGGAAPRSALGATTQQPQAPTSLFGPSPTQAAGGAPTQHHRGASRAHNSYYVTYLPEKDVPAAVSEEVFWPSAALAEDLYSALETRPGQSVVYIIFLLGAHAAVFGYARLLPRESQKGDNGVGVEWIRHHVFLREAVLRTVQSESLFKSREGVQLRVEQGASICELMDTAPVREDIPGNLANYTSGQGPNAGQRGGRGGRGGRGAAAAARSPISPSSPGGASAKGKAAVTSPHTVSPPQALGEAPGPAIPQPASKRIAATAAASSPSNGASAPAAAAAPQANGKVGAGSTGSGGKGGAGVSRTSSQPSSSEVAQSAAAPAASGHRGKKKGGAGPR